MTIHARVEPNWLPSVAVIWTVVPALLQYNPSDVTVVFGSLPLSKAPFPSEWTVVPLKPFSWSTKIAPGTALTVKVISVFG
jgi:hypothetical protein